MSDRTAETKRKWYDRIINVLASVVLLLLWKGCAWALAKYVPGTHSTEDEFFLWIVAAYVALNLDGKRRNAT